jgi:hypothetical protein
MQKNRQFDDNFLLITYPRTGSHFLHFYLKQLTGFEIKKTHFPRWSGDKKVITIIRDPEETLKSGFTMSKHHAVKRIKDFEWEERKYDKALTNITGYNYFFDYMTDKADVIIDYKTLIDRPYDVCVFLANYIGLNIAEKQDYIQILEDIPGQEYLVSSKTSEHYKDMDISWVDMTKHYERYYEMLAKKTI